MLSLIFRSSPSCWCMVRTPFLNCRDLESTLSSSGAVYLSLSDASRVASPQPLLNRPRQSTRTLLPSPINVRMNHISDSLPVSYRSVSRNVCIIVTVHPPLSVCSAIPLDYSRTIHKPVPQHFWSHFNCLGHLDNGHLVNPTAATFFLSFLRQFPSLFQGYRRDFLRKF